MRVEGTGQEGGGGGGGCLKIPFLYSYKKNVVDYGRVEIKRDKE